jgi:ABC-type glycerol-3-phosphate transport system substrate-binding protein
MPTATDVPTAGVRLVLLAALTPAEAQELTQQLSLFNQQSGIAVDLKNTPFVDFNDTLFDSDAKIKQPPPDLAILSYNHVVVLQGQGELEPLVLSDADQKDFLPDALLSNTFGAQQLYALPWVRSACLPLYRNLAIFKASKFPDEARKLIDFLTDPALQAQNFKAFVAYPTRQIVYIQQNIGCPEPQPKAIRLPADVPRAIALVLQRRQALAPLLAPNMINAFASAPLVNDNQLLGASAAIAEPPRSQADWEAALKKGVFVGALFLDTTLELKDHDGKVLDTIPPGDYAVKWEGDPQQGKLIYYVVRPDNSQIQVTSAVFMRMPGPVVPPASALQTGSHMVCEWPWDYCGCVTLPW